MAKVIIHKTRPKDWPPLGTIIMTPFKAKSTNTSTNKLNEQKPRTSKMTVQEETLFSDEVVVKKPFSKETERPWTGGELFINPDDETNKSNEQKLPVSKMTVQEETLFSDKVVAKKPEIGTLEISTEEMLKNGMWD